LNPACEDVMEPDEQFENERLRNRVAELEADARRWGLIRRKRVVLVIHDVPYCGEELDAAVDREIDSAKGDA
jgi:hypothetical protein